MRATITDTRDGSESPITYIDNDALAGHDRHGHRRALAQVRADNEREADERFVVKLLDAPRVVEAHLRQGGRELCITVETSDGKRYTGELTR
jgi:DNA-binding Lrp family transcriptional regulator